MKNSQKGFVVPMLILAIIILLAGGGLFFYSNNIVKAPPILPEEVNTAGTSTDNDQPTACTMDAKQCSDGSYVGRTGPNCEFVCPVNASSSTTTNSI